MPYLNATTSAAISPEAAASFLKEASKAVSTGAGKPEQYVMVKVAAEASMIFAGTNEPAAFLEMKSIGFPAQGVGGLAASLTELAAKHFGIPKDRIFIVFTDVKAAMWGQGGQTFG